MRAKVAGIDGIGSRTENRQDRWYRRSVAKNSCGRDRQEIDSAYSFYYLPVRRSTSFKKTVCKNFRGSTLLAIGVCREQCSSEEKATTQIQLQSCSFRPRPLDAIVPTYGADSTLSRRISSRSIYLEIRLFKRWLLRVPLIPNRCAY
jgi:hypothetical protein